MTPAPDTGRTAEELLDDLDHANTVTEPQRCADLMDDARLAIIALHADLIAARKAIADHEAAAADKRRLARMIDVAMHGEAGAAQRPSLCDLVGPADDLRRRAESAEKFMEMSATSGAFYARHAENATKRAEAAEAEAAQLRSRLLQAEKGGEAMRTELRPFADGEGEGLDEVVIYGSHIVHAETMSDTALWIGIHDQAGGLVHIWVNAVRRKGRLGIVMTATDEGERDTIAKAAPLPNTRSENTGGRGAP